MMTDARHAGPYRDEPPGRLPEGRHDRARRICCQTLPANPHAATCLLFTPDGRERPAPRLPG